MNISFSYLTENVYLQYNSLRSLVHCTFNVAHLLLNPTLLYSLCNNDIFHTYSKLTINLALSQLLQPTQKTQKEQTEAPQTLPAYSRL